MSFILKGLRKVNTYCYLYKCAVENLKKAKADESEESRFFHIMSALTFSAFSLEAYVNHAGSNLIPYWSQIESIRFLDKIRVIYSTLELNPDFSRRPLQTIIELKKFRDLMAHGKTDNIVVEKKIEERDLDPSRNIVDTKWEKFCNFREAERALVDVEEIINLICEKGNLEKYPLNSLGSASYSIETVN